MRPFLEPYLILTAVIGGCKSRLANETTTRAEDISYYQVSAKQERHSR
jgi:hypothetical protein